MHHPFTSPKRHDGCRAESRTCKMRWRTLNHMVINAEVGGGSVRIHNGDMQQTVFGYLGINEEVIAPEIRLPARRPEYVDFARTAGLAFGSGLSDHAADRHRTIVMLSPSRKPRRQRV
ncbi:amino acid--tRNA ligase-related protein [Shigella flexneri]